MKTKNSPLCGECTGGGCRRCNFTGFEGPKPKFTYCFKDESSSTGRRYAYADCLDEAFAQIGRYLGINIISIDRIY